MPGPALLPLCRGANHEQMVQCSGKSDLWENTEPRIKHPQAESYMVYFRIKRKTEILGQKLEYSFRVEYSTSMNCLVPSWLRKHPSLHSWRLISFVVFQFIDLVSPGSHVAVLCWANKRGYRWIFFPFDFLAHWQQTFQNFLPLQLQHDLNCIHPCLNPLGQKQPATIGKDIMSELCLVLYLCIKR